MNLKEITGFDSKRNIPLIKFFRNLLQKEDILVRHLESFNCQVNEANSVIDKLNRQRWEERKTKENALNR